MAEKKLQEIQQLKSWLLEFTTEKIIVERENDYLKARSRDYDDADNDDDGYEVGKIHPKVMYDLYDQPSCFSNRPKNSVRLLLPKPTRSNPTASVHRLPANRSNMPSHRHSDL